MIVGLVLLDEEQVSISKPVSTGRSDGRLLKRVSLVVHVMDLQTRWEWKTQSTSSICLFVSMPRGPALISRTEFFPGSS